MLGVCIVAFLLAVGTFAAPSPPQISSTFTTQVHIEIYDGNDHFTGSGLWSQDQAAGKSVENYEFDNNKYDSFTLLRYDIGESYRTSSVNKSMCEEFKLDGSMPDVWGWIALASYMGQAGKGNETVDVWEARIGYATMRLGVLVSNPSIPAWMVRDSRDERSTLYGFTTWSTSTPSSKNFVIPSACNASAPHKKASEPGEQCVSRDDAISRAKVWVANKVPYNQGGTYQGYREDCSGYVSMCWESSKPGHVTSTMHEIAHQITKDDLQPGDCLLYAAEHVVLFGGWLDSSKSQYQAYEETRPGEGTVTRPTPYPYWYSQNDFIPYRYNSIC